MKMPNDGIPAHFITISPEVAQKAIEGVPDLLAGEQRKATSVYSQHRHCKNGCGPTMEQCYGGSSFAFSDADWLIPRALLRCHACGFTMNPFDGMIVNTGDPNIAKYGDIPIIKGTGG